MTTLNPQLTLAQLVTIDPDTHLHFHKENNLLFPAVVELEEQLVS